jgi:hypothetical protein
MRDSQRQKLYDAERDTFALGSWVRFQNENTPLTIDECQAIVDAVYGAA